MSGLRGKIRRKKEDKLLQDSEEEVGLSNPSLDEGPDMTMPSGTDSSPELEAAEADALVKTLKTKRTKKKRELAQEVISPKDDLARQMKEAKRKSKAKVEESERQEMDETTALSEVAEDGTLPMPEGEEEVPVSPKEGEETEESKIKKLRRKKEPVEETPIEPPQLGDEEEETEQKEEIKEEKEEEEKAEEPIKPPSPEPEPDTDRKTPRMASMRAKMKERLAKAKEEAMTEVKEEAKESRRERRLQRDKSQKTRFDTDQPRSKFDEMEAEELERLTEEKRKQREERKKRLASTRKEGVYMPSAEESYDFFTRVWEPEPEEEEETVEKAETEPKEKKEKEEREEPKEEEEGVEPKPGTSEDKQPLIPAEDKDEYGLLVMSKAEYPDQEELLKKENEIYFYPSVSTIPASEKVGTQSEVRCLEDEGFYVGTRPTTSGWNQNRMEHRLLREAQSGHENCKKWFGEDGKLLALPDPLRSQPSRPPVTEEVEPYLQTVYKKAIIREFDNRYIDGTTEGGGHYQLDVDISQIGFTHHHLYSREHVLAQRLTQLYDQYIFRQKKNMTDYLAEKLRALKNSALHLQDHIVSHRSEHTLADRSNFDRRLQDYKSEIRQTRLQRDREEKTDRTLLKNIIHTWKEIKGQRELQKFNNTPVKLQIRKEEVDKTQDQFLWKQEIEEEIEELRDEFEREYKHKMLTYEEDMAKYQKQQTRKKEADRRIRKKKGRRGSKQSGVSALSDTPLEDYTEEQEKADKELLAEADLIQPEPPASFDEITVREQVKTKAMESRRRPGEPKLDLELSNTTTITPTTSCPSGEQKRRDDVSKCKVFVKILFNGKEVSRTNSKPLSQEFKVLYGQIYNLKIMQWPESISFQVYETSGLSSHLMAELCAPIPDTSVTSLSVQQEDLEFSSDHRVSHSHEGVGSGLPFTFGKTGQELITLMTTGTLTFSVAWAVNEEGQALVPPTLSSNITSMFNHMKKMDPLAAIGARGVMDMKKLADWFYESRLDPNDPSNADIVYILRGKSGDTSHLTPVEYFRLEQLMEEFDLVADEEMEANKRFQLLQLRDEEVQEFRNYKMVPVYDREIPRDTFTEYERKKREEQKLRQMDDIESHRAAVKRFRQRIREQVMRRFRVQSHMKRLEDVVIEEAVPSFAILGTNLLKIFERKAPLRPKRKERKKISAQNIKGEEVKILVNINRAQNVPVRMSSSSVPTGGTLTARETERKKADTTVRPFVEVMFQHNIMRTSVGEGSNPSFNEELEIPFK
ncbi:Coiled-coil and C2 domain-containing protein 2A [Mactra antiquata]